MLHWLEQTRPRTVILVARWRTLRSAERSPGEEGEPAYFRAQDARYADLGQAEAFDHLMEDLLTRLEQAGHRVVIVGSVPEMGVNIPRLMVQTSLWGIQMRAPLTTAEHVKRTGEVSNVLGEMALRHNVLQRDPAQFLCGEQCQIQQDGNLLYRDDDHLSQVGALFVVPRLMEPLEQMARTDDAGR